MFLKVISTSRALLTWCQPLHAFMWTKLGQIGPNWAKFGPNQAQTANFESRDPRPMLIACFWEYSPLPVHTWYYLSLHQWKFGSSGPKLGQSLGQIWAQLGPKSPIGPNWIGVPILIIETCIVMIIMTTLRAYLKWPCEYMISFELTLVKIWVKWTKIGPNIWPKWFNYGRWDNRLLTSIR